MRYVLPASLVGALTLGAGFALAQAVATPGIHAVVLPKGSSGAKQVQSTTLLETAHLKLVSITIPKGGVLPAHAASGQVSVQALSGSGELRMGARAEHLDATHAVVLSPGAEHEVRADAQNDLTLLVHEVVLGPGMMGHGMAGRGMGMGRGPNARGAPPAGVTPPSQAGEKKK